jgi:hypothetical protein
MLDTLRLTLGEYTIGADPELTVELPTFNAATKELGGYYRLWASGSTHQMGKKAYHNAEDWNFTLQAHGQDGDYTIVPQMSFSVPKLANGSNYEPADFKATETALINAERELRRIGVYTEIETATLSRVDSCKNVLMCESFQAYAPVLARLQGQRMNKRGYGTTFLWENTVQEVCVYDKREEMKRRKKNLSRVPRNVARFEHRLLKPRKVRDALGFSSAGDLLIGFDEVKKGYVTAMEKQLFRFSPVEVEIMTAGDFEARLTSFQASGKKNWLAGYLEAYALQQLGADKDAFLRAVENVTDNRMTFCRTRKKLMQAEINSLELEQLAPAKHTLGELYRELKREVLSA